MAGGDPYHDEQGVLRNKLGITDAQELSEIEYFITAARAESWERTTQFMTSRYILIKWQ